MGAPFLQPCYCLSILVAISSFGKIVTKYTPMNFKKLQYRAAKVLTSSSYETAAACDCEVWLAKMPYQSQV